jgi:two-component system, LuxR family, response regulator FixJ
VGRDSRGGGTLRIALALSSGPMPVTAGSPVYLVEDDAGMRDAVSLLLRGAGFEVHSYPSAEIFLSEVDCSPSICLLTDVRLPGMDGIALFRHLIRLGAEPAVVVITGHGDIPMAACGRIG